MKIFRPKIKSMCVNRLLSKTRSYRVLRVMAQRLSSVSLVVLISLFTACGEQPPPPVETVRAIRTITLNEPASGRMRRFSGVVEAADSSSVSFEVPGNVQEVKVDVGERISKGQVLVVLDDRTFRLNVKAAEADVGRAEVELREAQNDWERLQRIAEKDRGAVSQRALDQAKARYGSARNNLSYNTTRLNLAKRDLERTVLRSPFDGIVSKRYVDPFQQVALGQKLFDLHMEGAMEAAISVPESEIELNNDLLVSLLLELRRKEAAGQLRVVEGRMPSLDTIQRLPGRELYDPWNNGRKPTYADEVPAWQQRLDQQGP